MGYLVSYRDPNLEKSMEFTKESSLSEEFDIDDRDMNTVSIGTISNLDRDESGGIGQPLIA